MDEGIRAGLDRKRRKTLRIFGFAWAALFSLFAWRLAAKGHSWARDLWLPAGLLAALALLRPGVLDGVERRVSRVGKFVVRVNTAVVLTLVYYLVLAPYAVLVRIFGGDPLSRSWEAGSYWEKRRTGDDLSSYERPF